VAPQIVYLSHGGGPMPLLGDPGHQQLVTALTLLGHELAKPKTILLISAHWEAPQATLTAATQPELIYDYYGFPPASYEIKYPCPGNPALAQEVEAALQAMQIPVQMDFHRGYDHGLFVPLKLMFPQADIPCIQLSLLQNLDAGAHIRMGRALSQLDVEGLMIIGSGYSFHNMRAFRLPSTPEIELANRSFDGWLTETCLATDISEADREQSLIHWQQAPYARFCHPREEHLLPLHVCYGAAQRPGQRHIPVKIGDKLASLYIW